jgi:DNA-binding transcriptional regulator YiaG
MNLGKIIKDEIRRIATLESRRNTQKVAKQLAQQKRDIADLKKRVRQLERDNRKLVARADKKREAALQPTEAEKERARITAEGIKRLREKFGMSQREFGSLVGVTAQSVYNWEHQEGTLTLRSKAKEGILAARKMGVREARQRLEEIEGEETGEAAA